MIQWSTIPGLICLSSFFTLILVKFLCKYHNTLWSNPYSILELVSSCQQSESDTAYFSRCIEPQIFESDASERSIHFPLPESAPLHEQVFVYCFFLYIDFRNYTFFFIMAICMLLMKLMTKLLCRSSVFFCCLQSRIQRRTYQLT